MIDSSGAINLNSNIKDLKSYYKSNSNNTYETTDFNSYLSKEVKNNLPNEKSNVLNRKKSNDNNNEKSLKAKENNALAKELTTEVSEKLEKILSNEDFDLDSLDEELQQVILLLLNLIEVTYENIDTSSSEIINYDGLKVIEEGNDISNKSTMLDKDLLIDIDGNNTVIDTKEALNNINDLLVKLLDSINSNTLSETDSLVNIKEELVQEFKGLINLLPNKTVTEIEEKLDSDISKEIFNTLLAKTKNEINKVEGNDDNSILNDVDTKIVSKYTSKSNENFEEDNYSDNSNSKNNISNKEEKVLMKILEDDSNQSFSKTLNYYDKLNNTNSFVEVINEPVIINKDNINVDFIKNIRYMVKNSVEELQVKIYPKELGEMTIKLISEEGIMRAEIKATSKETYNLLNSNLNEIKKTLENQNIRIQEVNIGIYNEDTTFFSDKESSKEAFEYQKIDSINRISNLEEEEVIDSLLNEGNVNLLA